MGLWPNRKPRNQLVYGSCLYARCRTTGSKKRPLKITLFNECLDKKVATHTAGRLKMVTDSTNRLAWVVKATKLKLDTEKKHDVGRLIKYFPHYQREMWTYKT